MKRGNHMHNEILRIGRFTIHGYGLMIAIGVVAALVVATLRAKKKGLDGDITFNLTILSVISGFIGAKILYILVEWKDFIQNPLMVVSGSGFVVYGGIIVGALTAVLYCRWKKISFMSYFDLLMPSVAIAQGFGRLGCLLAGCCYGQPTDAWYGIVFQTSAIAPNGVSLFPSQIVSSLMNFAIAAILILFARKNKIAGRVGALYLILYSVGRFIIEFFRNDFRGSIGFMSTSQFISIFVIVLALALFFRNKWWKKSSNEEYKPILKEGERTQLHLDEEPTDEEYPTKEDDNCCVDAEIESVDESTEDELSEDPSDDEHLDEDTDPKE